MEARHDPGPTRGEGHGQPDGDVVGGRVPLALPKQEGIFVGIQGILPFPDI